MATRSHPNKMSAKRTELASKYFGKNGTSSPAPVSSVPVDAVSPAAFAIGPGTGSGCAQSGCAPKCPPSNNLDDLLKIVALMCKPQPAPVVNVTVNSKEKCSEDNLGCMGCLSRDGRCLGYNNRIALAKGQAAFDCDVQGQHPVGLAEKGSSDDSLDGHYYNSHHKSLIHDLATGHLTAAGELDYESEVTAIVTGDQAGLDAVKVAGNYPSSVSGGVTPISQLNDPLGSLASTTLGADSCTLLLTAPPELCSLAMGAQMVELYAMMIARDLPFDRYATGLASLPADYYPAGSGPSGASLAFLTGANLLADLNSDSRVKDNLVHNTVVQAAGAFNASNTFRTDFAGVTLGPYLSQFFYLNIPAGNTSTVQKYESYITAAERLGINPIDVTDSTQAGTTAAAWAGAVGSNQSVGIEWGHNNKEIANGQNTFILLPPVITDIAANNAKVETQPSSGAGQLVNRFVYSGRSLGEYVHNDPVFRPYETAAIILNALGTAKNPGMKLGANQNANVTGASLGACTMAMGEVCQLARVVAWYWKWQVYRKARPEVVSLLLDNQKTGRTSACYCDSGNGFDLAFGHTILGKVKNWNAAFGLYKDSVYTPVSSLTQPALVDSELSAANYANSYTFSQLFREGSPTHPTYPAAHSVQGGACITVIKCFFDDTVAWNAASIPALQGAASPSNTTKRFFSASSFFSGAIPASGDLIVDVDSTSVPSRPGAFLQQVPAVAGMTVGTELNKLASNIAIGRNWAGVHFRADSTEGVLLGERVAIRYMQDKLSTWYQNTPNASVGTNVTFTDLYGKRKTIVATPCAL